MAPPESLFRIFWGQDEKWRNTNWGTGKLAYIAARAQGNFHMPEIVTELRRRPVILRVLVSFGGYAGIILN